MSNYTFSGSEWLVEYIGTGFNQVQATLKFDPCAGGHFDFMQIRHISATWILEDF